MLTHSHACCSLGSWFTPADTVLDAPTCTPKMPLSMPCTASRSCCFSARRCLAASAYGTVLLLVAPAAAAATCLLDGCQVADLLHCSTRQRCGVVCVSVPSMSQLGAGKAGSNTCTCCQACAMQGCSTSVQVVYLLEEKRFAVAQHTNVCACRY